MKLKTGLVVREVGAKKVAVAVGELARTFHGMITIGNRTSELIWQALSENTDEESIVALLMNEFGSGADKKTVKDDVKLYIDKLRRAGLLDES